MAPKKRFTKAVSFWIWFPWAVCFRECLWMSQSSFTGPSPKCPACTSRMFLPTLPMLDAWLETSGNTALVMKSTRSTLRAKVATFMKLAELWKKNSKTCGTAHKTCTHYSEAFFLWIGGMRTTGRSLTRIPSNLFICPLLHYLPCFIWFSFM